MSYYVAMADVGERYVLFVRAWLRRHGVEARYYTTAEDQIGHGDLDISVEVKFDRQMRQTGRIFIECAERRHISGAYVPSGIFARSDARWYWVGDYYAWYAFRREALRVAANTRGMIEIGRKTSRGFLLSCREASLLATRRGEFSDEDREAWVEECYEQARAGRTEGGRRTPREAETGAGAGAGSDAQGVRARPEGREW